MIFAGAIVRGKGQGVAIDPQAFEKYRRAASDRTTLPRLVAGVAVIVVFWVLSTLAVILAGMFVYARLAGAEGTAPDMTGFLATPAGVVTALGSFAGIWIGVWIAMRFLHGEKLSALFGSSRRIAWGGFVKGFLAVLLTSLVSEVLLYALEPQISRGSIGIAWWLVALVPVALLTLVQTSAEELLFRAYLPLGLARRFASALIWAVLPVLVFTSLHWSGSATPLMNAAGLATIGVFAALLMLLVYATGNLGAAMGAHLANNLFGFLLISHQEAYNAFALFTARPLEGAGWSGAEALAITGIGIACTLLTGLLLLHPRSPLKVEADPGSKVTV
jgi:membrane protease YdiL (CAAX protease family)